jgi:D-sedoheptulose 7-phosphate isomerase
MIVFTNGCFDVLHAGHVDLLERARALGDKLIVGINSDRSVSAIRGPGRPVQDESARKAVLLGLRSVDEVVIFDEATPEKLIERLRPDILVKGGDWAINEIIGADLVRSYGGEVHSLPLKDGYSSSSIINRIRTEPDSEKPHFSSGPNQGPIEEHIEVMQSLGAECSQAIDACSALLIDTFEKGKKVLLCGNGGSAADSQHIAAEFTGRYETERRALPAISLTTDTSALTAIGNDYGFERVFARQVEALAVKGDCLIAISTSGNSPNVIAAVMDARARGCKVIGMTGSGGKKLASLSDQCVMVPSTRTARIQEAHITIAHVWCEMVDNHYAKKERNEADAVINADPR